MISKTTMKKLEKCGYTVEDVQKCWELWEQYGMTYKEFGKMMKVRAENP
jgi:trimethylamine:corrinoid methyltransferase-like protein